MTFLLTVVIAALCIVFVHALFFDGMLLAPLRRSFLSHLPLFVRKPLFECVVCMTSVWGTLLYVAAALAGYGFGLLLFLPYLFAVGGILVLIRPLIAATEELYGEYYVLSEESKRFAENQTWLKVQRNLLEEREQRITHREKELGAALEQFMAMQQEVKPIGYKVRKPAVIKAK